MMKLINLYQLIKNKYVSMDRKYPWQLISFLFILFTIPIIVLLTNGKNVLFFGNANALYNASLSLPLDVNVKVGKPFNASVILDTGGGSVRGADVLINFDKTVLQLNSIEPMASIDTSLKTFLPADSYGNFLGSNVVAQANQAGYIKFGAVTADYASQNITQAYSGVTVLANLTFTPLKAGSTSVSFVNGTDTSNSSIVALDSNTPTNILNSVNNMTVQIAASSTSSPTPAITTTPSSSSTPSQSPTSTPVPTLTTTSSNTGNTVSNKITLSLQSIEDGLNQDDNKSYTKTSTLWLGNAGGVSYTALRFSGVNLPKGVKVTSASLQVNSSQSQWISTAFSIAAEATGNSLPFSNNSKISSRSLTSAQASHNDNVNWNANTWYTLDDITSVIQEVVNRSDWQSGNALSLIMKGTGSAWGRKFIYNYKSNVSPKLTIAYESIQSPTSTSIPTSTPTQTPTSTLTPTPKLSSSATLAFHINSSADDANEENNSISLNGGTTWLGNASSATASFSGYRFTNVNIPKGQAIKSAKLQVYSSQSQWIGIAFTMAAEASGNSPAFSSGNLLSSRPLTSAQVNHSDDAQWNANTWYTLDDITSVIQEVVNRSDWQSGNALSIIMKGTGSAWGRKFIQSYDGNTSFAPTLTISY